MLKLEHRYDLRPAWHLFIMVLPVNSIPRLILLII